MCSARRLYKIDPESLAQVRKYAERRQRMERDKTGTALAGELATLAGLDVADMLAGLLVTDSEWAAFVDGLAKITARHPDKADELAALVELVNTAAERMAPA